MVRVALAGGAALLGGGAAAPAAPVPNGLARPAAAQITVYAASSLTDVFPKIDSRQKYSFAASSTLAQQLHEGGRLESTSHRPVEFRELLTRSEESVKALGAILSKQPVDTAAADGAFKVATESCTACHKVYRD